MADDKTENNASKLKWTVMVYMAGDNNLAEEMIFSLKSMHDVGSTDKVQVVAWSDSVGSPVPFDIPQRKSKKRAGKKRGQPARGNPAPEPVLSVTEDHDLKKKQEAFLKKKDRFAVKNREEEIQEGQATLVEAEEQILNERTELGDKYVGKARAAVEKVKKALKERSAAQLKARSASANLVKRNSDKKNPARGSVPPRPNQNKRHSNRDTDVKDAKDQTRLELSEFATELPVADVLTTFVIDSVTRYPAEHYALILSGHGSGAVGDFLTSNKQFFSLSIPGLSESLTAAGQECNNMGKAAGDPWLDILGFDSCLMSMAEVGYEVRGSVRYMVASEGFETATGWAYDRIIALLHRNPNLQPRDLASKTVDQHIDYYDDYTVADVSVDLSALDLKRMDDLVVELGKSQKGRAAPGFALLLRDGLDSEAIKDAIVLAHWEAQGYKNEQYADLWDFCACLSRRTEKMNSDLASRITRACDRVQKSIQSLVFRSGYRGAEFQHSHGVSIFFPWADLKDAAEVSEVDHYGLLAFAGNTQWDEFLRKYFASTIRPLREPRQGEGLLRQSFLNVRPFLVTGVAPPKPAKNPPFSPRNPPFSPRNPPFSPRNPPFSPRNPPFSPRNPPFSPRNPPFSPRIAGGGGQPPKIASMKNPAINWKKLKPNQT